MADDGVLAEVDSERRTRPTRAEDKWSGTSSGRQRPEQKLVTHRRRRKTTTSAKKFLATRTRTSRRTRDGQCRGTGWRAEEREHQISEREGEAKQAGESAVVDRGVGELGFSSLEGRIL
jgi:hypothetical protein